MEPLPIGSGNHDDEPRHHDHSPASMEPLPIGSGNWKPADLCLWPYPCFNGATANRQWERGEALRVDALEVVASMEPLPIGSGNYRKGVQGEIDRTASMEPLPIGSGNPTVDDDAPDGVAASMEPLPIGSGNALQRLVAPAVVSASMEPLPIGSGNQQLRLRAGPHRQRFNGATANRQWELAEALAATQAYVELQWSHCQSAVGTGRGPGRHASLRGASMEPLPIGSGNSSEVLLKTGWPSRLQWSHCQSAVGTKSVIRGP